MIKHKILVSPTTFNSEPLNLLGDYEIIRNPFGRVMTSSEVIELGSDCIGIVAGIETLNSAVLHSLSSLRCISRCGVGVDNVDLIKAKELGVIVVNTPDAPTQAVAELTVGLILTFLRHVAEADTAIRAGRWVQPVGRLLGKQKLGIVGCGRIGSAVADLIKPFGTELLGYDSNVNKHPTIQLVSLDELLQEVDIVSLHFPYTKLVHHLVDSKFIGMMKRESLLINTSRGGIVDEKALYDAVASGHLAGACVDVFEEMPYNGPLVELDNVILTSHIGAYTKETKLGQQMQAVENLLGVLHE